MQPHSLPWIDPLILASAAQGPMVLLYSSAPTAYSGANSLLAYDLEDSVEAYDFLQLADKLSTDQLPFTNAWFGYLGYGLRHTLEHLPSASPSAISLVPLWMGRFRHIFHFNHTAHTLTCWSNAPPRIPPTAAAKPLPAVTSLASNMDKATYLAHVQRIIDEVHAGNLYQANLTRKFYGQFAYAPDTLSLFARLCKISPAPYSAYIRLPSGATVLSSSPERFLHIDTFGHITTRPIKGSARRVPNPEEDAAIAAALAASPKDRAENLMIVDLMRNDLSRSCVPGSVEVERMFDVTTHATVHHLSSTIRGQKRHNLPAIDAVRACFPPGSMTGAPKLAAMQLCSALEPHERGVYSGALGWFGGDGSADLSVVIRTLLVKSECFEFQVGGGIVADSSPEKELEETLIKSKGIARTLGLKEEVLAAL